MVLWKALKCYARVAVQTFKNNKNHEKIAFIYYPTEDVTAKQSEEPKDFSCIIKWLKRL